MEQIWTSTGPRKNVFYGEWLNVTHPLTRGDRVRIKEGYDGAGRVYYYVGKDAGEAGQVAVTTLPQIHEYDEDNEQDYFLADAIEPYPYTREERIERAIEDYAERLCMIAECDIPITDDDRALLYAILDAGV